MCIRDSLYTADLIFETGDYTKAMRFYQAAIDKSESVPFLHETAMAHLMSAMRRGNRGDDFPRIAEAFLAKHPDAWNVRLDYADYLMATPKAVSYTHLLTLRTGGQQLLYISCAVVVLADGDVLHLRCDDAGTGVMHMADVPARLGAQGLALQTGEAQFVQGLVGSPLAAEFRCQVGQRLGIAALGNPLRAQRRQSVADVDLGLGIGIGAVSYTHLASIRQASSVRRAGLRRWRRRSSRGAGRRQARRQRHTPS